ncbi:hypothetical protein MTO96_009887 [Rhipicephalus appendiculatus]
MNYDGRRTGGGAKVRGPFDSSAHRWRPMNGSETPLGRPCIIGVYRLCRSAHAGREHTAAATGPGGARRRDAPCSPSAAAALCQRRTTYLRNCQRSIALRNESR